MIKIEGNCLLLNDDSYYRLEKGSHKMIIQKLNLQLKREKTLNVDEFNLCINLVNNYYK